MAVVTRPSSILPCEKYFYNNVRGRSSARSRCVMTIKSIWSSLQIQLCTLAVSVSLFDVVRVPRDAFRYGPMPYLLAYTLTTLIVALPVSLLQLTIGQLTQQDTVGVWRAVPILRGVGHLKIVTSYICCVYYTVYVALALAYLIWITKGSFPLKDCTKLQMTQDGYEYKMNATECFNSTFLAPFAEYKQYLGIMAILIFVLWFFAPILLYALRKSLRILLVIAIPVIIIATCVLTASVGDRRLISSLLPSIEQWKEMSQPYLWHSALVQALLSNHIISGYLVSAGGSIYKNSDIRWTATAISLENIVACWAWMFVWQATSGGVKDTTFVAILVLIYQSAISEQRAKEWPLLAFAIVSLAGIITILMLLYPVYDKMHRMGGDRWRLIAFSASALGTALTMIVLSRSSESLSMLDDLIIPFLVVFITALEVVSFVFIYGWDVLLVDIEFLTGGRKLCWCWVAGWWIAPIVLLGIGGWWTRSLIRSTWLQPYTTLWPMVGVLVAALSLIICVAAMVVAKEEQYNLLTKIAAAFRPSRLWGPEDFLTRFQWLSQRQHDTYRSNGREPSIISDIYSSPMTTKDGIYSRSWIADNFVCQRPYLPQRSVRRDQQYLFKNTVQNKMRLNSKFPFSNLRFTNVEMNQDENCKCDRHFTLHVPHIMKKGEATTCF